MPWRQIKVNKPAALEGQPEMDKKINENLHPARLFFSCVATLVRFLYFDIFVEKCSVFCCVKILNEYFCLILEIIMCLYKVAKYKLNK